MEYLHRSPKKQSFQRLEGPSWSDYSYWNHPWRRILVTNSNVDQHLYVWQRKLVFRAYFVTVVKVNATRIREFFFLCFFFLPVVILASQAWCWMGLIKSNTNKFWISYLICTWSSGKKFLEACWTSLSIVQARLIPPPQASNRVRAVPLNGLMHMLSW